MILYEMHWYLVDSCVAAWSNSCPQNFIHVINKIPQVHLPYINIYTDQKPNDMEFETL